MDTQIHELDDLVRRALAIADDLQLWGIGIALDTARHNIEQLSGAVPEHASLQ